MCVCVCVCMYILLKEKRAQSAGAVEYTTASLQGDKTPPTNIMVYGMKQSDAEALVMLNLWGMQSTLHYHRSQALTLARNSST